MLAGNRNPWPMLVFWLLISVASLFYCSRLSFSYDFEKFFPDDDPALPFFKEFRKTFGHDNEFILLAIENKKGIFRKDFLKKINELTEKLKKLPFVREVNSPVNLKKTSFAGLGPQQLNLLHYADSTLYAYDSLAIYGSEQWKNTFFASDAKSVCLYINSDMGLSKGKSDRLATAIKGCLAGFEFDDVHLAGRIFAQAVYLKKLQEQFVLFLVSSFILISCLLWITFRNVGAIVLPLSLVFLSLLITFGIMGLMGRSIDIMAIMIPSMVFVAGMSDVVHFYTKYADELNKNRPPREIFRLIYREVAGPTFLTLLSTVAGFLSLCYSGIKPIRDFGLFTSVGITVAYILTYTYLPAILMVFPAGGRKKATLHSVTDFRMQRLFSWVIRNSKLVLTVTVLVLIGCGAGFFRLRTNQTILEDLPAHERVKKDLLFFEQNYGGVRPLEVDVRVKREGGSIFDKDLILQVNMVEEAMHRVYRPGFLVSPASVLKSVNYAYDEVYIIPPDTSDFNRNVSVIRQNRHQKNLKTIISPDGKRGRISAKMRDAGSREIAVYNRDLLSLIRYKTDTTALAFTITGTANLIDINNKNLITNTLQGLYTGIGVLALLTLILHRSFKMMIVFLVPNVVPLVIMAGVMGLCGIELKSSTAIFFSIAFGIATDDTIHFISRFRLELKSGFPPMRAFMRTYFETGKAVFLTTLILLGGFISLIVSDFQSIYLFGLLTALTLFVALLSEIFLLPVLLAMLFRKKKQD